ncbi:MAG: cysteine--tRNA ligase, partial [Clostridia bacterium]|nr:cysteine--tRNA ligase [Clostridia bacterium]
NFFTVRDVAATYGYEPIRFFLISSSYRSPINYNAEIIEQAQAALDRLYNCKNGLEFAAKNAPAGDTDAAFLAKLDARREQFITAMDDDLNTADGIAALFELVRDINLMLAPATATLGTIEAAQKLFGELCDVLGLLYSRDVAGDDDAEIEALIAARATARKEKNWAEADRIRDELKARNIILEDTPQGVKWHRG